MSTDYHLECTKCGRAFGWDGDRQPKSRRDLSCLAALSAKLTAIARLASEFEAMVDDPEWKIELTHWRFGGRDAGGAQLSDLASACDHELEVMDEYGHWADPSVYPIGTRASNAYRATSVAELCSGRCEEEKA